MAEVERLDHDAAAKIGECWRVVWSGRGKAGAFSSGAHGSKAFALLGGFMGESIGHGLPCTVVLISVR